MAKYSRRADGRFCTTITVLIDGEKKKRTIYGKTVRELDDKGAEVRAQANRGGVDFSSALRYNIVRGWLIFISEARLFV